jgi:hypothetical protein
MARFHKSVPDEDPEAGKKGGSTMSDLPEEVQRELKQIVTTLEDLASRVQALLTSLFS